MKRMLPVLLVIVLVFVIDSPGASAVEPEWHSEQPVAAGLGVPVPLGEIGGMAFWGPNKGVLITNGNGGMPGGVYAYDGSGWYLYSTVCGGFEGDIAISGPDEFWTISEYGEAQEGTGSGGAQNVERSRTLCHFANGEVVKSYAEPAVSGFYLSMRAAACAGTADCWFAGAAYPDIDPNQDPFHLHWDGSEVTAVPSMTAREPEIAAMPGSVEGLAFAQGRLFESASDAPFLREVSLADSQRFLPIESPAGIQGPFVLSSEPLQEQLWAGSKTGAVLRLGPAGFETLLGPGEHFEEFNENGITAVGIEPGTGSAWLAGGQAEVRSMAVDGSLGPSVHLPQADEELNSYGNVTNLECPAPSQCWAATRKGWLFHLGGPPAEGVNTDPLMHRLITYRPPDGSTRKLVQAGLPEDNSGEVETKKEEPHLRSEFPHRQKVPSIVKGKVNQKVIHKTILQLAFTLRGKAHVRLLAKHHKEVVAKTPPLTLGKGRHRIRLQLDPKRWPTSLDFQVHAVTKTSSK